MPLSITSGITLEVEFGDRIATKFSVWGGHRPYRVWENHEPDLEVSSQGWVQGKATWLGVREISITATDADGTRVDSGLRVIVTMPGGIGRSYVERRGKSIVRVGPTGTIEASAEWPPVTENPIPPTQVAAVSPDGRWVSVRWGGRNLDAGAILDLQGRRPPVVTGGCQFSPNGQRALCGAGGIYAPLEVIDLRSGEREQLGDFMGAAWVDDRTVAIVTFAGEGQAPRAVQRRVFPLGPPTKLMTEGLSLEPTWEPGAIVQVPFDPWWWSLHPDRPPVGLGASWRRSCVAALDGRVMACVGRGTHTVSRSDDLYSRFTYPRTGRIDFIDTTTARVMRSVERDDCVLTPVQFLGNGELRASCVPMTRAAMGRATEVLRVDFPRWRQVQQLEREGFDVLIDSESGNVVELPMRLPDTWVLV